MTSTSQAIIQLRERSSNLQKALVDDQKKFENWTNAYLNSINQIVQKSKDAEERNARNETIIQRKWSLLNFFRFFLVRDSANKGLQTTHQIAGNSTH